MYRFSISTTACFYVVVCIGSMEREPKPRRKDKLEIADLSFFHRAPSDGQPRPKCTDDESPPAPVFTLIPHDEPRPPASQRQEDPRTSADRLSAAMVLRNASFPDQWRNSPPYAATLLLDLRCRSRRPHRLRHPKSPQSLRGRPTRMALARPPGQRWQKTRPRRFRPDLPYPKNSTPPRPSTIAPSIASCCHSRVL